MLQVEREATRTGSWAELGHRGAGVRVMYRHGTSLPLQAGETCRSGYSKGRTAARLGNLDEEPSMPSRTMLATPISDNLAGKVTGR